jgi:hypothetical protein
MGRGITVDGNGVRRVREDGSVEQLNWPDLVEVAVVTTADGPFVEDVSFVLTGRDGSGCVIPHSAPEGPALIERLQELPGFDNEALVRAMSSTEDKKFVCWRL